MVGDHIGSPGVVDFCFFLRDLITSTSYTLVGAGRIKSAPAPAPRQIRQIKSPPAPALRQVRQTSPRPPSDKSPDKYYFELAQISDKTNMAGCTMNGEFLVQIEKSAFPAVVEGARRAAVKPVKCS